MNYLWARGVKTNTQKRETGVSGPLFGATCPTFPTSPCLSSSCLLQISLPSSSHFLLVHYLYKVKTLCIWNRRLSCRLTIFTLLCDRGGKSNRAPNRISPRLLQYYTPFVFYPDPITGLTVTLCDITGIHTV